MIKRKVGLGFALILFLAPVVGIILQIHVVEAQGTITIRDDGMIIPGDSPITKSDPTTFIFTGNPERGTKLVVEMNDAVIDGDGRYSLTGSGEGIGVLIREKQRVTIKNLVIQDFQVGIMLESSDVCRIEGNTIENNDGDGIVLVLSYSNFLFRNIIRENGDDGLEIQDRSEQNTINSNMIVENLNNGINILDASSFNVISANSFIDNFSQVGNYNGGHNYWSGDYPSGGNYWSDYTDIYPANDDFSGPDQNEDGSDNIWDHPYYVYPEQNIYDSYPLVNSSFRIPTSITIVLSHRTINSGNTLTISGQISPEISGERVTLTFIPPSETWFYESNNTQSDGKYTFAYTPNEIGDWKLKASWSGSLTHFNSETIFKDFTVSSGGGGGSEPIIPGFPWESILIGALLGVVTVYMLRKKKVSTSSTSN